MSNFENDYFEFLTKTVIDQRTYHFNRQTGLLEITPEDPFSPLLGKYFSFDSPYHRAVLTEQNFYLSHPEQFNDPFDSFPNLIPDSFWKSKDYARFVLENADLEGWDEGCFHEKFRDNFKRLLEMGLGICCFTDCPLNEVMWGYYGGQRGFYLQFEHHDLLQTFQVRRSFKMNYLPLQKLGEGLDPILYGLMICLFKSEKWKHENEYRIVKLNRAYQTKRPNGEIIDGEAREINWKLSSLKGIFLGHRFLVNATYDRNNNDFFFSESDPERSNKFDFIKLISSLKDIPIYSVGIEPSTLKLVGEPAIIKVKDQWRFTVEFLKDKPPFLCNCGNCQV